jgi:hypothetical protein
MGYTPRDPNRLASASLAFLSSLIPILTGQVDWRLATTFTLTSPFPGWFGDVTDGWPLSDRLRRPGV